MCQKQERICPFLHVIGSLKDVGAEGAKVEKLFGCVNIGHNVPSAPRGNSPG
jgi:hypothetical protein